MFGPARFFAPYAYVIFDFWEEYVEISLLDDLGGEVKRSGEMSVVITTHCGGGGRPWRRSGVFVGIVDNTMVTVVEFHSVRQNSIDFCIPMNIFKGFLIPCNTF